MKKTLALILTILLFAVNLTGCSRYTSSYRAVGFVHSANSGAASMTFLSFEGTIVFRLKPGRALPANLIYNGSLESGKATVWIDCGGTKTELFSVEGGEAMQGSCNPPEGHAFYILVETDGECRGGDFLFDLFYD